MISHFCVGSIISGIGVGLMIGAWLSIRLELEPLFILLLGVPLAAVGGMLVRSKARRRSGEEKVET